MIDQLANKTAVVTGAASGIGLALAQAFAREDMNVVLADIDEEALSMAVAQTGASAIGRVVDVADAGSVEALAEHAYRAFGEVHVLCNNAGVSGLSPLPSWELPLETWRWVMGVNIMGIVHGHASFIPRMLEGGAPGHIVNTASLAGVVSFGSGGAYGPSKHAAVALSELVALELATRQASIGVSIVCPAWVATSRKTCRFEMSRPSVKYARKTTSTTAS